jgi:threonine dehydrogenase-like Zn-dependent dehydrogenase
MKAVIPFGPKDMRMIELPDPDPQVGEVLIAVKGSGICGSDKWIWNATEKIEKVFGHEVAGEVVALGPEVKSLRVGDRVAVHNEISCGKCPACRSGSFISCPSWKEGISVNGGFGELVAAPARNCLRLADQVDYESACMIFDNFGTPYSALQTARVALGDDVIIAGLGPIGLAAVILARLQGAFVIAIDPIAYRREKALQLGANLAIPPGAGTVEIIRQYTDGLGARVAIECSGHKSSYPLLLSALRWKGIMVTVGGGGHIELDVDTSLIALALSISGSNYSTMADARQVHELFRSGKVDPRVLVTHRGPLAELPNLLSLVCEQPERVLKSVILN